MSTHWTRREFVSAAAAAGTLPSLSFAGQQESMLTKAIPATGEALPVIGLGTSRVFDVDSTPSEIATRANIISTLTGAGGSLIDTSPMYNRAEKVVGDVITSRNNLDQLFIATKVWTNGEASGRRQMQQSASLMHRDVVDLMQVHNLRDTAVHMRTISELKEEKRLRYSGLTHYRANAHDAIIREMQEFKPDFIQINYSLGEPESADRVLPMAQDLGIAVMINRPFQSGRLFSAVSGQELPDWASSFAQSWGQFFLKFIISHPAVTCVIPATSKPHHMLDNIGAGFGELPDAAKRKRMADYFASL